MHTKVIAFDADDTLWVNEPYFRETEDKFCALLEDYLPFHVIAQELFKTEIKNLSLYGYGAKGFILSMIETAMHISKNTVNVQVIEKIVALGKELLNKPVVLLDGVEKTLQALQPYYTLVVATKGDLLDQQRKLKKSGLEHYFHHIEIMSEKQEPDYLKILHHLNIEPNAFLMVGNSLKSDVLPVLSIGGKAVHIPYHTTWAYEQVAHNVHHENLLTVQKIEDIVHFLIS